MPQELLINDFSAGWIPSDDALNGRKNGLLKMDNLELDQNGALVLSGGVTKVFQTPFSFAALDIYSKFIVSGNSYVKKRYLALTNGDIYRDQTLIASNGALNKTAFNAAYNRVFICSDNVRIKDDGVNTYPLGLTTPANALSIKVQPPASIDIRRTTTNYILLATRLNRSRSFASEGLLIVDDFGDLEITTSRTTFRAKVQNINSSDFGPLDTATYASGNGGLDDDVFKLELKCEDTDKISKIRFEVLLEPPNADGLVSNYYYYEWLNTSTRLIDDVTVGGTLPLPIARSRRQVNSFNFGSNQWSSLGIIRKDFNRAGEDSSKDWHAVYGIRISIQGTAETTVIIGKIFISGGARSPLKGTYEWIQVNVSTIHAYIGKSAVGPTSASFWTDMSHATITPDIPTDPQVNQIWIFRRGGTLQEFLRVKVLDKDFGGFGSFDDTVSDVEALEVNINLNLFLQSVNSTGLPFQIFSILGPIYGRMIYFTREGAFISDENNPDSYDTRNVVRYSGSSSNIGVELFLWAQKVAENSILIGTSQDIYLLTGTFVQLPEGFLDIYLRALGTPHVPISFDSCVYNGFVIYMAADGWRSINVGGISELLTVPNTDRLYRGQICYDYQPPFIRPNGQIRFNCTVGKNKFWCIIPHIGNSRRIEVYDFSRKYWRTLFMDPDLIYAEEDNNLIAFFPDTLYLANIDNQTTKSLDNDVNQNTLQTPTLLTGFFNVNLPRNRKDSYTLKFKINTGGHDIAVKIFLNENLASPIFNKNANTTDLTEAVFDISDLLDSFGKSWQFLLSGQTNELILNDISVNYDTRPTQLTHLRIPATQYGTSARKRLETIPFVIDTLGNDVTFTPLIDGTPAGSFLVNCTRKQVFDYLFTYDDIGKDFEYLIHAANDKLFEFYELLQPRNIQIFPEQAKYFVIIPTNFGNAQKKRVRTWPFVIDPLNGSVLFTPIVDGIPQTITTTFTGAGKLTRFHFFIDDVFGIDYSGIFSSSNPFELWEVMNPEIVQILPIAKRFDQVGPEHLWRYGKIKEFELRIIPFGGTVLPFKLYFNDQDRYDGSITMVDATEDTYRIVVPKTTANQILRLELGPTSFNFHRYYIRFQTAKGGKDTELEWVTVPGA